MHRQYPTIRPLPLKRVEVGEGRPLLALCDCGSGGFLCILSYEARPGGLRIRSKRERGGYVLWLGMYSDRACAVIGHVLIYETENATTKRIDIWRRRGLEPASLPN